MENNKKSVAIMVIPMVISLISLLFSMYTYFLTSKESVQIQMDRLDEMYVEVTEDFIDRYSVGEFDSGNIDEGFSIYFPLEVTVYNNSNHPCLIKNDIVLKDENVVEYRDDNKTEFVDERIVEYGSKTHFLSIPYYLDDDQKEYVYTEVKNFFDEYPLDKPIGYIDRQYGGRKHFYPFDVVSAIERGMERYFTDNPKTIEYKYTLETTRKEYSRVFSVNPLEIISN